MIILDNFGSKVEKALKDLSVGIEAEVERRFGEWIADDDVATYLTFLRGGKVIYSTEYNMIRHQKTQTLYEMAIDFIEFEFAELESSDTEIINGIRETALELRKAANVIEKNLEALLKVWPDT